MMKPYNKHLNINSRDNALKKVHFSSLLILIATIYSSKSFSLTNLEYCPSHTYQSWDQAQTDFSRVSALEASLPDSDIKKNHVSIPNNYLHYYASMSAGYGSWRDISPTDGETGIMGLAFGAQHYTNNSISLGGELEMQSGNHMRIHSTNAVEIIGVQPVFLTIKSYPSILLTFSFHPIANALFISAKGGAAYLNAMIDNISIPNKTKILPEAQIGFGVSIHDNVNLIAYYECLFGGNPVLTNFDLDKGTATLDNLPTLQAGFIGVQIIF